MSKQASINRKRSYDNRYNTSQQTQQLGDQKLNESEHQSSSAKDAELQQIQNQIKTIPDEHDEQKDLQKQQQKSKSQFETLQPNKYTVYRQSFNLKWNMKEFDISKAVQQFGGLNRYPQLEDSDEEDFNKPSHEQKKQQHQDQIKLRVYKSSKQATGINKRTTYVVTCRQKGDKFEITRHFNQFVLLRQKLLIRWPGCFIPPIPTKKFGNNPYQLVIIRMKFLNNFLKCLEKIKQLYYGVQCQIFFKHQGDYINTNGKTILTELEKLKPYSNSELLEIYKNVYSNKIEDLTEQQQKIAIDQIKQLETQLKSWKVDLSRFKDEIRSLILSKDKYYEAMTRLSTVILPQVQSVILDWINDEKFSKPLQSTSQVEKQSHKQRYLLNTNEYGTALRDAAASIKNYNQSLWIIYDIFKFQLKQTDAVLQCIESYEFLVRQMDYLSRNININKQQKQSLDQKKTTIKIFMMMGSVEEKKSRIAKESEEFEAKLVIVKQLLNYVLNLLINSIDNFHNDRAETYKKLLSKSSCEQLVLIKKLMDFHLFELETFRKKQLFNKKDKIKQDQEIIEQ